MTKKIVNGFVEEEIDDILQNSIASEDDGEMVDDCKKSTDENNENVESVEGSSTNLEKKEKKRKKGIIYVSNIPKHMNVTRIREFLGQYGDIGRIYLQPEKKSAAKEKKKGKRGKRLARHFTEGWIEFSSKRVAKQLAEKLNNTQIGTRKKSQFYDKLWSLKYLPRFKWIHLSERMSYEQAVHKQKLMTEVSQARREANFFQNNLDKSEMQQKKDKKLNKSKN